MDAMTKMNNKKTLNVSQEYTQASFTWITSLALTVILALNCFNFTTQTIKPYVFSAFVAYALFTCFQLLITMKIKKDLLKSGSIQNTTRKLGYLQMVSIVTGNIITVAFAFNLVNKEKNTRIHFCRLYATYPDFHYWDIGIEFI